MFEEGKCKTGIANNKYMKHHDASTESSYLMYCIANNSYGWVMSQKMHMNILEWRKDKFMFGEEFIQHYNKDSDKGYILEVDAKCLKKLHKLHTDLSSLPAKIMIENCDKLKCNMHDKTIFAIQKKPGIR